jgi:SPP1 gp7 family putative phage head morphogenesis protein
VAVSEGLAAGDGLNELIARVRGAAFADNQARALMVARTESVGAYNFATWDAWEQSGGEVETKQWLSSQDPAVRESHSEADGQSVLLDDPFVVGAALLMHPGDDTAPPGETINCRCTMLAGLAPKRLKWLRPANRIKALVS